MSEYARFKSYDFDALAIGESMEVTGVESRIRTACSMWGARYGIWLQAEKIDDGVLRITRIPEPITQKRLGQYERLEQRMDAMANLLRVMSDKLNTIYEQAH